MKILYLTCSENVIESGIYESQVKKLICKITQYRKDNISITQLAILPAVVIGRKGINFNFIKNKKKLLEQKKDMAEYSVNFKIFFIPIVTTKKRVFHLNVPFLLINISMIFTLLLFHFLRHKYDIIHCRSYTSTLCALMAKFIINKTKVIFDVRGFLPEEGIVHKAWDKKSISYKVWKMIEKKLFLYSDKVICLSDRFMDYVRNIEPQANCCIVHASIDLREFKINPELATIARKELKIEENTVFVYNGSLGSWHDPLSLGQLFKEIKKGVINSKLLVLTNFSNNDLSNIFDRIGLERNDYIIKSCRPHEVHKYLLAGDYGIVPLRNIKADNGAMKVIADTMIGLKVPEYLAAGLPIIINNNIKGIRSLMDKYNIGIFFDINNLSNLGDNINIISRKYNIYTKDCVNVAEKHFNINDAAFAYYGIYEELVSNS